MTQLTETKRVLDEVADATASIEHHPADSDDYLAMRVKSAIYFTAVSPNGVVLR